MITVYVLTNNDKEIYIGQTNNLTRRLSEHNRGHTTSTQSKSLWRVAHFEESENRSMAVRRERALKSSRGRDWIRAVVTRDK